MDYSYLRSILHRTTKTNWYSALSDTLSLTKKVYIPRSSVSSQVTVQSSLTITAQIQKLSISKPQRVVAFYLVYMNEDGPKESGGGSSPDLWLDILQRDHMSLHQ